MLSDREIREIEERTVARGVIRVLTRLGAGVRLQHEYGRS